MGASMRTRDREVHVFIIFKLKKLHVTSL